MYDLFIELTNQIFWEGYAEQLAKDDPERFNFEYRDFLQNYWQIPFMFFCGSAFE